MVINIEIKIVDNWFEDQIVDLYKAGGWWKDSYDSSQIKNLIKGSFGFAIALDNTINKAIGMARILSDGISDAYIQDVVVLPNYQKKGIGRKLIETLVKYCLTKGILWIGIISEPNKDKFYSNLGFMKMENYIPMRYKV